MSSKTSPALGVSCDAWLGIAMLKQIYGQESALCPHCGEILTAQNPARRVGPIPKEYNGYTVMVFMKPWPFECPKCDRGFGVRVTMPNETRSATPRAEEDSDVYGDGNDE